MREKAWMNFHAVARGWSNDSCCIQLCCSTPAQNVVQVHVHSRAWDLLYERSKVNLMQGGSECKTTHPAFAESSKSTIYCICERRYPSTLWPSASTPKVRQKQRRDHIDIHKTVGQNSRLMGLPSMLWIQKVLLCCDLLRISFSHCVLLPGPCEFDDWFVFSSWNEQTGRDMPSCTWPRHIKKHPDQDKQAICFTKCTWALSSDLWWWHVL